MRPESPRRLGASEARAFLAGAAIVAVVAATGYLASRAPAEVPLTIEPLPTTDASRSTRARTKTVPTARPENPKSAEPPTGRVVVHIAGEVRRPGVYELDATMRVAEALRHAGGASPEGDPSAVNLAARLRDGQRIAIPRRKELRLKRSRSEEPRLASSSSPRRARKSPRPLRGTLAAEPRGPLAPARIVPPVEGVAVASPSAAKKETDPEPRESQRNPMRNILPEFDFYTGRRLRPPRRIDPDAELLRLNRATVKQLAALPGMDENTAATIVRERRRRGGFRSTRDLFGLHLVASGTVSRILPYLRL